MTEIKLNVPNYRGLNINGAAVKDHSKLKNLEFENSGHTGFQKELTFDDVPTKGSNNPVKSKGIRSELDKKADQSYVDEIESSFRAEFEVDEAKIQSLEGTAVTLVNDTQQLKTDVDTVETELDLHAKNIVALQQEDGNIRSEMYAYKQGILASTDESLEDLKSKSIPHTVAVAGDYVGERMITVTDFLANEKILSARLRVPEDNVGFYNETTGKYELYTHITGKNLIPVDKYVKEQISASGITWKTNTDGTITANGTTTAQSTYKFLSGAVNTCLPPGTYRISGCPEGGGYGKYRIEYAFGSTGSGYDISNPNDFGSGVIVNAPNGIKNIYAKIIINSGVTCDNLTFKPQLEIGSVKTEFEPAKKNTITITRNNAWVLGDRELLYNWDDAVSPPGHTGDLITIDSETNNIICNDGTTDVYLGDLEYYQDINKVITELKNAVLAQGADV